MSDKIQKAREALYDEDDPMNRTRNRRAVLDALDEAEVNAKRVAELTKENAISAACRQEFWDDMVAESRRADAAEERVAELEAAHSGQSHSASMCAAKSAKKDAEIARLREALQAADKFLVRHHTDPNDDCAWADWEVTVLGEHIRLVLSQTAPATPEAKPAGCPNPDHANLYGCHGNTSDCKPAEPAKCKCGRPWHWQVFADCDVTKPAEPAKDCRYSNAAGVCLAGVMGEPCSVHNPPAPEAAPCDTPDCRLTMAVAVGLRDENADLRAQLAAAQARLPGPKSMVCTVAEWDRLWRELDAAEARIQHLEEAYAGVTGRSEEALAAAQARVKELEKEDARLSAALDEELKNRDDALDVIADAAAQLGCTEEWSNCHDHGVCIFDFAGEMHERLQAANARADQYHELMLEQDARLAREKGELREERDAALRERDEYLRHAQESVVLYRKERDAKDEVASQLLATQQDRHHILTERDALRRTLAEAVERLRLLAEVMLQPCTAMGQPAYRIVVSRDRIDGAQAFLARLSAAKGDDNG